jgi:O-antigen/teichoic acid export membrane protein
MSIIRTRLGRLFWIFFEKFGLIGLSIISFFIFANYLTPVQLGLGILLLSAVEFSSVFLIAIVDSSIIRLKSITQENDGTVFWLLFISSSALAALIYGMYYLYFDDGSILLAGLIATLLLPLQAMSRIHIIHLRRNKSFKQLANRTILGKLAGMIVGVYLAIKGYGELAVVAHATIMSAVSTLLLLMSERRRLPLIIDFKWAKEQLVVGLPASLKVLNDDLYTKGTVFVIEGTLGTQALGFYNFANRLIALPRGAILTALMSYAHPVFSGKKNRGDNLTNFFISSTKISLMVVLPMFIGLALVAEPLVDLLFKDKWLPSGQILMGIAVLTSFHLTFLFLPSLLIANGENKLGLKGQIVSSIVALTSLIPLLTYFGLIGVIYALAIRIAIILPVNFYAMSKVAPAAKIEFLTICFKTLVPCLIMAAAMTIVDYSFSLDNIVNLLVQITVGAITWH